MSTEPTPATPAPAPGPAPLTPMDKTTIQGSHILSLICLGLVILIHILAPVIWRGTVFTAVSGKAMYWIGDIFLVLVFIIIDVILWFQNFDNMSMFKTFASWGMVLGIFAWILFWNCTAASNVSQGLPAVYQKK